MIKFNVDEEIRDLGDYINRITDFGIKDGILWYRGHGNRDFKLLPTLYRDKKVNFVDDARNYNSMHMAEHTRIQQYYAKNYPFVNGNGGNTTEWLGMAQHYGIK